MSTPNPINDVRIAELTEIQTSISNLQDSLRTLQSSVNTQQSLSLPDLTSFKTDIKHVIKTIDEITQNDGTPLMIYITSLIKDMIINKDNIFYEKKSDGSINITNRLRGEFDILKIFEGNNDLKTKFLNKLDDISVFPNINPDKKTEIKNALNVILP